MKQIVQTLCTFAFASAFAISTNLHAHSESHEKEVPDHDPVKNEFGMFDPEMTPTKFIEVIMSDSMQFTPDVIHVKQGDVVKLTHINTGKLIHEFVLGTPESLDEHAEMMKKFPGMEHEEPYMIHVDPGEIGVLTWKFSETGEFSFGCLIPGHYDAGMKGKVIVES